LLVFRVTFDCGRNNSSRWSVTNKLVRE